MADELPDGSDPPEWARRSSTPEVQPTPEEIEADPDIECPRCRGDMWIVEGQPDYRAEDPEADVIRKCVECGYRNDAD